MTIIHSLLLLLLFLDENLIHPNNTTQPLSRPNSPRLPNLQNSNLLPKIPRLNIPLHNRNSRRSLVPNRN